MAKLVSNVYGDALFELALQQDRIDDFDDEVKVILDVLKENEDLSKMMCHPQIVKDEKVEVVESIFKGRVNDEIVGLMVMVIEKDHFKDMEDIFTYYINRVKEYKNIGVAYVTTPMELSDSRKKSIEKKLLDTTDYVSFEMNYEVDPELIGGMVIRIGDRVVDSSVKTKIYELSREMSKIQLKVGETAP
ncbi:MAG: ATP synthase F1 subunit delta [Lachnospiraceae bacterium]|nr:ATP synthase F1 subunit delta [Lachnospiraceae bacterium]